MRSTVRLGILGGGRIVERRILPAVMSLGSGEVTAIASHRPDVARRLAAEWRIPRSYDRYEDLLNDKEIDAVYLPASGDQHCRWTIAAAQAGKHVLCEKPLAPTFAEAERMARVCREAGVLLQEAFMWRHHPRAKLVRQLVQDGAIGETVQIIVSFSFDIDRSDWRLRPERGGGAMADLGCYGINFARFLTAHEPTAIAAAARYGHTGVDMSMCAGLTFPGEVLVNIDCSFEAPFRCRAEITGTSGRMLLHHAFQPDQDASVQIWRSTKRDQPQEVLSVRPANQFACEFEDFCRSIQAGLLLDPAENGLANMWVLNAVLSAARNSRHGG